MLQVPLERMNGTVYFQPFVHSPANESCLVTKEQPHQPIRIPIPMANPLAPVKRTTRHAESSGATRLIPLQ